MNSYVYCRFIRVSKELNMKISTEKTKSMVIFKESIRCKLVVYDKSIEQVMSFKYLGVKTTSSRNLPKEVYAKLTMPHKYLREVI